MRASELATSWVESTERRAATRDRVDCEARLVLTSGTRAGRIVNLSQLGARVEVTTPPLRGMTVLLQWHGHEAFAKVAWSQADACGLAFERPIARNLVTELAGEPEPAGESMVKHCNIPLGQKRGGRLRLVEG